MGGYGEGPISDPGPELSYNPRKTPAQCGPQIQGLGKCWLWVHSPRSRVQGRPG